VQEVRWCLSAYTTSENCTLHGTTRSLPLCFVAQYIRLFITVARPPAVAGHSRPRVATLVAHMHAMVAVVEVPLVLLRRLVGGAEASVVLVSCVRGPLKLLVLLDRRCHGRDEPFGHAICELYAR